MKIIQISINYLDKKDKFHTRTAAECYWADTDKAAEEEVHWIWLAQTLICKAN